MGAHSGQGCAPWQPRCDEGRYRPTKRCQAGSGGMGWPAAPGQPPWSRNGPWLLRAMRGARGQARLAAQITDREDTAMPHRCARSSTATLAAALLAALAAFTQVACQDPATDLLAAGAVRPGLPAVPSLRGADEAGTAQKPQATVTGILPMRACHSLGPVSCTLVPAESTATVTGMSLTSNS